MTSSNNTSNVQAKWFVPAILLVIMLGFTWTLSAGKIRENRERESISLRAQTAAAALKNYDLHTLTGTATDLFNPEYIKLKDTLGNIKYSNTDVRFVYLMARSPVPDKLLFLVDNEPADSPDISLPGDIYNETTPEELEAFTTAAAFVEGPDTDEWGTWISGFAPLFDQETGQVRALLGMDIDASLWYKNINEARALPIIVSLFFLSCLTLLYLFEQRIDKVRRELVSLTSHQLSTPLTGIKWYAESLSDGDLGPLNPRQSEYVKQILSSADRLVVLVQHILDISRIERGQKFEINKESTDLSEVINLVVKDLVELLEEKNVIIKKSNSFPKSLILNIDKEKFQQVFQNLISNAVKYSKSGGEVILDYQEKAGRITLSVKDSGLGIPKAEQAHIFEKFFRATNVRNHNNSGNGLGLFLAKMIVERHGGKLWFESVENQGTTFFVSLPKK